MNLHTQTHGMPSRINKAFAEETAQNFPAVLPKSRQNMSAVWFILDNKKVWCDSSHALMCHKQSREWLGALPPNSSLFQGWWKCRLGTRNAARITCKYSWLAFVTSEFFVLDIQNPVADSSRDAFWKQLPGGMGWYTWGKPSPGGVTSFSQCHTGTCMGFCKRHFFAIQFSVSCAMQQMSISIFLLSYFLHAAANTVVSFSERRHCQCTLT